MLYDSLLLVAVLIVSTALVRWRAGDAIDPGHGASHIAFQLYLLLVIYGFFGWFWTHGGQTLGMRAWRIQVRRTDGGSVTWGRAALRFLGALFSALALGAGFLWVLVDPKQRAWHDRISGTVLVQIS
ncbi:MAG: hypothetical protein B7Z66_03920 [Chromatiales bacterium 21-64-14]|nr:MAG: hypothetical protein B7Z66_03920 [Chromatiales bacterium 21-64-14]